MHIVVFEVDMISAHFTRPLKCIFLATLSSLLLVIAYPLYDMEILIWIGLIPLLYTLVGKKPFVGLLISYFCGILFFLGVFHWILKVNGYTIFHHAFLALYLGFYFGLFGLFFCLISRRDGYHRALIVTPFIWVCLEYIRSNFFFLALPWALLAHSQHQQLYVVQIAGIVGTYGISFLIVMVNAALASLILYFSQLPYIRTNNKDQRFEFKQSYTLVVIATLLLAITLIYGHVTLSRPITGKPVSIALTQGNIEQVKKFDPDYADEIMRIYTSLTREAAASYPDLIVWPETATPKSVGPNSPLNKSLFDLVNEVNIPILTGSAEHLKFEKTEEPEENFHNSAFLFEPNLERPESQKYNKIRLFPFGEYLPIENIVPWNRFSIPRLSRYVPGKQPVVFELAAFRFSATICWENVFPALVRKFVLNGAECIINITNEGHFGKTAAPYQLAAISVFRAVENRIYVVRCGNTGISCIIDPNGQIVGSIKDRKSNHIFIRGVLNGDIKQIKTKSFYTRYGDIAAAASFLGAIIAVSLSVLRQSYF